MPEKPAKLRATACISGDSQRPPHPKYLSPRFRTFPFLRRPKRRKAFRILSCSASEPIFLTAAAIGSGEIGGGSCGAAERLPRPLTSTAVVSPSLWSNFSSAMRESMEEVKVVMSVAVEGSPGPVKVMVQLGASVEEMITIVIEKYGSEGRSPRLNLEATPYFELHHSQFTLQSLKKSDKIGEVGGRSFYLRTNSSCSNHGLNLGIETSYNCFYPDAIIEIDQLPEDHKSSAISSSHPFLATSAISFNKIERRTKRICKLVACFLCV